MQDDNYKEVPLDEMEMASNINDENKERTKATPSTTSSSEKLGLIVKMSIPMIISQFIQKLQETVNLAVIGHQKDIEPAQLRAMVAGVGLGNTTQKVFALSLVYGLNQSIETLVSQAWGGGEKQLCGVYLNRGRYLLTLFFIPITLIILNTKKILLLLGQDEQSSMYAQEYMTVFLPGLFILAHIDIHRRFLNCIGRKNVPLYSLLLGIFIHIILSYYFVIVLKMGITGTGLAGVIMNMVILIVQITYANMKVGEIEGVIGWPDRQTISYEGAVSYLKLGLPCVYGQMIDSWAFELMVIVTGYFGVIAQASQIIIMNIGAQCYRVGYGLDQAACTLIGQPIGSGNVREARQYFKIMSAYSASIISVVIVLVFLARAQIVQLFTSDTAIQNRILSLLWIQLITQFPDCYKGYYRGVFKALAIQKKAVWIGLVGQWIINISFIWLLAFYFGYGHAGVLFAKMIVEYFICTSFGITVMNHDWEISAEDSKQRQNKDKKQIAQ